MTPKPYTDEEIVEKLEDGRLAATSLSSAINLALCHSKVKVEYDFNDIPFSYSIPRSPNRRALRREELPNWVQDWWTEESLESTRSYGWEYVVNDQDGSRAELYVIEPQEPLVISTEGGE